MVFGKFNQNLLIFGVFFHRRRIGQIHNFFTQNTKNEETKQKNQTESFV